MPQEKVVVVHNDMVTPYGWGVDSCWKGLISGSTAIDRLNRFSTESFQSNNAAVIPGLESDSSESLVMKMLVPLFERQPLFVPRDALLFLATTTGEIDILERHVLSGQGEAAHSRLDYLSEKVRRLSGVDAPGAVISAACSSASMAIAQAAGMISQEKCNCVLVVACDAVSEFAFAGFSGINALDSDKAKPFDRDRSGLTVGEAAGFVLLMSRSRALKEERPILAEIAGWGASSDANHITGPSKDGHGLALAIRKALRITQISHKAVGCISAHGTGTVYNDSMEIKAFKSVFKDDAVPVYSIKGGTGHTMGAAGLIEIIVAIRSLSEKRVPPTVNLHKVDNEAKEWVSLESRAFDGLTTLSTNSGFGGINAALVLREMHG